MLVEVETFEFDFRAGTQTDRLVQQEEEDQRNATRPDQRDADPLNWVMT